VCVCFVIRSVLIKLRHFVGPDARIAAQRQCTTMCSVWLQPVLCVPLHTAVLRGSLLFGCMRQFDVVAFVCDNKLTLFLLFAF